jgi:tetrahydromethanopterin S-methyltransferase subunit G
MNEDETRSLNDRSLLDQILRKLEVVYTRLQFVERKIEERAFDTKPIWEKALSEIVEINQRITTIDRKLDLFSRDVLSLRADQLAVEDRLRTLESS